MDRCIRTPSATMVTERVRSSVCGIGRKALLDAVKCPCCRTRGFQSSCRRQRPYPNGVANALAWRRKKKRIWTAQVHDTGCYAARNVSIWCTELYKEQLGMKLTRWVGFSAVVLFAACRGDSGGKQAN